MGIAMSHDDTRQMMSAALFGMALAIALHVYLTATWPYYLYSVPGYPEAFQLGNAPVPHLLASPASQDHGQIVFLLGGGIAGVLLRQRNWRVAAALPLSAGAAEGLLMFPLDGFPGNLWPLDAVGIVIVAVAPAAIGVGSGFAATWLVARFGRAR
jgi:hypothetical protein